MDIGQLPSADALLLVVFEMKEEKPLIEKWKRTMLESFKNDAELLSKIGWLSRSDKDVHQRTLEIIEQDLKKLFDEQQK